MSVKITEKDKALLILLAIIVVIFAAVMLPSYGIKALYEQTQLVEENTTQLDNENQLKLLEIIADGIPQRYAEDYQRAQESMEYNILHKKYEAIKTSNIICNYSETSYNVPYEWVENIKYLGYQINELNLFVAIDYEEQTENGDGEISFANTVEGEADEIVPVLLSTMKLNISPDGLNEFGYETEMLDSSVDMSTYSLLLVYLAQLEQKGSILINSYEYSPDETININLTIYMPSEGDMENYSALIGECPNCGEPYYYADAENGDYVCSECNTPIAQQ